MWATLQLWLRARVSTAYWNTRWICALAYFGCLTSRLNLVRSIQLAYIIPACFSLNLWVFVLQGRVGFNAACPVLYLVTCRILLLGPYVIYLNRPDFLWRVGSISASTRRVRHARIVLCQYQPTLLARSKVESAFLTDTKRDYVSDLFRENNLITEKVTKFAKKQRNWVTTNRIA